MAARLSERSPWSSDHVIIDRDGTLWMRKGIGLNRFRGLLLDFYGTLVHEDDVNITAICAEIQRHATVAATVEEIDNFWSTTFFAWWDGAHGDNFLTQREIGLRSLAETLDRFRAPLKPATLIAPQVAHWGAPPIFADTWTFLAGVQELDLPICVVSNVDRVDIEAAIAFHGLQFEHLITSDDARAYKPRPEMFVAGLERLGLRHDEVLHIGDSRSSDVGGATAMGIPVAWVNRTGKLPQVT